MRYSKPYISVKDERISNLLMRMEKEAAKLGDDQDQGK